METKYVPEHFPPVIFGERYFGSAFAEKTLESQCPVHGLGADWRQLATTRVSIWRDLFSCGTCDARLPPLVMLSVDYIYTPLNFPQT